MKYTLALLVTGLLILTTACEPDEEIDLNLLEYAGVNSTSPFLPEGSYSFAARFPASVLTERIGKEMISVELFIYDVPSSAILTINQGNASTPGTLLYSDNVTDNLSPNIGNTIFLNSPIEITGEDIWVVYTVEQTENQQVLGCDAGPRDSNGDRFFNTTDGWTTFQDFANGESINWNIALRLRD